MPKINYPPFSVNKCWKGQRIKTEEYESYEDICLCLLPKLEIDKECKNFILILEFGIFNILKADADNLVKPFQDILQKKYGFDDRFIFNLLIRKVKAKKGQEYIKFNLINYENLNDDSKGLFDSLFSFD